MPSPAPLTEQDLQVRHFIYTFFVEHAQPPTIQDCAAHFSLTPDQARESYYRLHDRHAVVLEADTDAIRMASPLSAVPTLYRVSVPTKSYWANCAWDSLGIPAMLKQDADIEARIPHTSETVHYAVRDGALVGPPGIVHFALPVRQWYDDLVHT